MSPPSPGCALVLAGGGARGAYEVGVLQFVAEELLPPGAPLPFDILCGTSVGAINACALAAGADDARGAVALLAEQWSRLVVHDVLRITTGDLLATARALVAAPPPARDGARTSRGLVDASGLERIVAGSIRFDRLAEHVRTGRVAAVTVSTTHVATGRTVVFVHGRSPLRPSRPNDPMLFAEGPVGAEHALASAAIPLVFPAVRLDGEFYCDGGLRQNVPLSPARRLGAEGMLIVNPRADAPAPPDSVRRAREGAFPGPLFLLGKTLNALMLDRLDHDLDRLERINRILAAGTRRFGPGFVDALNDELGHAPGEGLRELRTAVVRASVDIGRLCAEHVRSARFAPHVRGILGAFLRRLADGDGTDEADLLSYVLFDGDLARELMAMGREDARRSREALESVVRAPARDGLVFSGRPRV